MAGLVLDCSVAMAWSFDDEVTPGLDAILENVRDVGAVVPALWFLEVANTLLKGLRRGRISSEAIMSQLSLFDRLPIGRDPAGHGSEWRNRVMTLAQEERLTAYDAAYLELALRTGLPMATADIALQSSAVRRGVVLIC